MCDLTLNEIVYKECPCVGCHYACKKDCDECMAYDMWLEERSRTSYSSHIEGILKREVERMFRE